MPPGTSRPVNPAHLAARPGALAGAVAGAPLPEGAVLRLPSGDPAALVVTFHGAGGTAAQAVALLAHVADDAGLALLAVPSRAATWDVIAGGWGPDVRAVDAAIAAAFGRLPGVERVVLAGFSDGASYALSVGLANGGLVDAVLAFSPGFAAPPAQEGAPRLYLSHGTRDRVLPVDRCSRRLVLALRAAGYDVTYDEFDGPHTVPPEVVRRALAWLAGSGAVD